MIVFGVTVAWSIYTTGTKALELYDAENNSKDPPTEKDSLLKQEETADGAGPIEDICPEMKVIRTQEDKHFTLQRIVFILANFSILFVT